MELLLPTLIILSIFIGMWLIMHNFYRYQHARRSLPEREAYAAAHDGETERCHACASTELKEEGLDAGDDDRRIVICLACKTLLYRYQQAA